MSTQAVTPTEKQYDKLRLLASGAAGLSFPKRETEALLRRGWVTAHWRPPYYQWVRITVDGLKALARAVEKYGLPELEPHYRTRVCVDCGHAWKPRCRCGGRTYLYETRTPDDEPGGAPEPAN